MAQQSAVLLRKSTNQLYRVRAELQEGRWIDFVYSERVMAREHYYQLLNGGVIGGYAVKKIDFEEFDGKNYAKK